MKNRQKSNLDLKTSPVSVNKFNTSEFNNQASFEQSGLPTDFQKVNKLSATTSNEQNYASDTIFSRAMSPETAKLKEMMIKSPICKIDVRPYSSYKSNVDILGFDSNLQLRNDGTMSKDEIRRVLSNNDQFLTRNLKTGNLKRSDITYDKVFPNNFMSNLDNKIYDFPEKKIDGSTPTKKTYTLNEKIKLFKENQPKFKSSITHDDILKDMITRMNQKTLDNNSRKNYMNFQNIDSENRSINEKKILIDKNNMLVKMNSFKSIKIKRNKSRDFRNIDNSSRLLSSNSRITDADCTQTDNIKRIRVKNSKRCGSDSLNQSEQRGSDYLHRDNIKNNESTQENIFQNIPNSEKKGSFNILNDDLNFSKDSVTQKPHNFKLNLNEIDIEENNKVSDFKSISKMGSASEDKFITRPHSKDQTKTNGIENANQKQTAQQKSAKQFKFVPRILSGNSQTQKKTESSNINNLIVPKKINVSLTKMLSKQNYILHKSDISRNFKNVERANLHIGDQVRLHKLFAKPYLNKINSLYIMSPVYMKKIAEIRNN